MAEDREVGARVTLEFDPENPGAWRIAEMKTIKESDLQEETQEGTFRVISTTSGTADNASAAMGDLQAFRREAARILAIPEDAPSWRVLAVMAAREISRTQLADEAVQLREVRANLNDVLGLPPDSDWGQILHRVAGLTVEARRG